jgi:hypothetical protein
MRISTVNIKTTLLAALAASALVATNASATYIAGSSLQGVLDDVTVGGPSSINVNDDQFQPDEEWDFTASGGSFSRLIIELAGYRDSNAFGVYDVGDPTNMLQLFGGANDAGDLAVLADAGGNTFLNLGTGDTATFSSSLFGFYLDSPDGTFYSKQSLNDDGGDHMVAFRGTGDWLRLPGTSANREWTPNEFILAWEDLYGLGDQDYDDFVVMIESVTGVPEPSTLALYGISLLGLGLSLMGRPGSRRRMG